MDNNNSRMDIMISIVLGALVVIAVGILLYNNFNKQNYSNRKYHISVPGYTGEDIKDYTQKDNCVYYTGNDNKDKVVCGNYIIEKL